MKCLVNIFILSCTCMHAQFHSKTEYLRMRLVHNFIFELIKLQEGPVKKYRQQVHICIIITVTINREIIVINNSLFIFYCLNNLLIQITHNISSLVVYTETMSTYINLTERYVQCVSYHSLKPLFLYIILLILSLNSNVDAIEICVIVFASLNNPF